MTMEVRRSRTPWPYQKCTSVTFVPASLDDEPQNTTHNTTPGPSGEEIGLWYSSVTSEETVTQSEDDKSKIRKRLTGVKRKVSLPSLRLTTRPTQLTEVSSTAISAFLMAAQHNNTGHLNRCLESGINIDVTDQFGWTALMCAACNGSMPAVQYLLGRGADSKVVNNSGTVAWQCAYKNGHLAIAKLLLSHGSTLSSNGVFHTRNGVTSSNCDSTHTSSNVSQTSSDTILNSYNFSHPGDEIALRNNAIMSSQSKKCCQKLTTAPLTPIKVETDDREVHECLTCRLTFSGANWKAHLTSTVHQFNRCTDGVHCSGVADYHIPESNIGFQLMLKDGWNREEGLGPDGAGVRYPPKTVLKRDRQGLGNRPASKARVTHFGPNDVSALKRHTKPFNVRQSTKRERERKARQDRLKEINFRRELNS